MLRGRPPFLIASLLATALLCAMAAPAFAQDPPPAPDPTEPDRIRAAYVARRDPAILLDLAASLRRLGRHADAAVVYDEWRLTPGADPARSEEVARALAEIDASYVGTLAVTFDDPAAQVWVDGRLLPGLRSGAVMRIDPGEHRITASRRSAPPAVVLVRVGVREAKNVELRLGTYLPPNAPLPAPPPILVQVPPPMAPPPSGNEGARTAGTALVVTGALGVAVGIGAGIAALYLASESSTHCLGGGLACDQTGVDDQQRAHVSGNVCTIGLGAGGAVLLTGIILRAVNKGSNVRGNAAVHPSATGLGVTW